MFHARNATEGRGLISTRGTRLLALTTLIVAGILCGCEESPLLGPDGGGIQRAPGGGGVLPPAGLVDVSLGEERLTIWPYTGTSFDGTPSDPVNLIFAGEADPVQIRAALLSLDGNRPGLPPVYPFDAVWSDAIGDAHTTYAGDEGWVGSVIQLQLGNYGPIRFHLRLFRSGSGFGEDGTWSVGAAHFEVVIPGTAEHQVLSWELAEQIVVYDLMRTGLLDPSVPVVPTGPINQAPSFRTIPAVIYNGLPDELIGLIGGPPKPVSAPVPIASDGIGKILNVAVAAPVSAGTASQSFTVQLGQVIPRPFCMEGPFDWVYVSGPVDFEKTATVDGGGAYEYSSQYSGHLTATPVDITQTPPRPIGEPFPAIVGETQSGLLDAVTSLVNLHSRRIAPGNGGSEYLLTNLRVATNGSNSFSSRAQCQ